MYILMPRVKDEYARYIDYTDSSDAS